MREDNYINIDVVERISNQVWRCADLLYQSAAVDSTKLVLFLLSAYKDDAFPRIQYINDSNWVEEFFQALKHDSFYNKILNVYSDNLKSIHPNAFAEVVQCFYQIDKYQLKNNFSEVFEHLLQKFIDYQGKRSGESIQPKEISRLIIELANLDSNAKVYNPFAGLASFSIYLKDDQEYHGQEINTSTWAIGQLRLKAHSKGCSFSYELDNSIKNWNEFQKFDLIVATPPFKMRLQRPLYSNLIDNNYRDVESFLVDKGIRSLSNNGKLITVFSLSFLFSGGRLAKLKRSLIDNNLIDTIITLPSGLLSNTSIPICILIFKTISSRPGYIKFIDASSFFTKDGPRSKRLNDFKLIELINQDTENEFLRYINVEEIYNNDFDLSVGRYFLKDIQGTKISDFSSIIRGLRAPINEHMKQVQIRNLKGDVFDSVLTTEELENTLINRGAFRVIDESCLLIATRWNTLKPTFFKYTGEPIVISQAIVALRLNENIVNPTFLINEFSADYVLKQLNSYRVGSVQPMLRKKDLENIKFQLPSIQEQRAKVSGIIELTKRLRKIETEKENILSGIHKEETESSTSLSHILGKPLLSIGSSIEIIQNALSNLDPNWKSYLISQKRQFTLVDAFDSITKNVKYIQELADKNTSLVSVSNFELSELHFLKFLSEFVKDEKKSLNNNISLKLDIHEDIKELMDNQVLIKGNPQKLRIALVNLLDNAKIHAFTNKEKSNKIVIEILPFTNNEEVASYFNYDIDVKKSYVEVKISNTGNSFPKDFTLKDYSRKNFSAGKTRNRGLGGYEVNEILKAHNEGKNALNIVSNKEDSEYSTTVSFIIPIL
ncbi:N-6 DNA methylase [Polaribacter dokdonensis]|uniref:site-specific DNA-methyltransferase (adenine-specific) n=1 Tax=Polaribacter dokdonensis DSW-5 TaxID=1300348 RepID=A0A0N0CFI3_9FLAO|nr:N-6 DNA methylase [Polaribacter dokdonensis]KOY51930.1 N-6 DNA methylase [Polaribacter dokdonensis DSW-5]SED99605.1 type I restriction enzyme M protein [Polaribacter dokdonensis DSW-5]